jgi:hypothetical protein
MGVYDRTPPPVSDWQGSQLEQALAGRGKPKEKKKVEVGEPTKGETKSDRRRSMQSTDRKAVTSGASFPAQAQYGSGKQLHSGAA